MAFLGGTMKVVVLEGDTIRVEVEVTDKRETKGDRGSSPTPIDPQPARQVVLEATIQRMIRRG
jgi:acyl dehydratase